MDEFYWPAIDIVAQSLPAYCEVLPLLGAELITDLIVVDHPQVVRVILSIGFFQVDKFVDVRNVLEHQLDILVQLCLRTCRYKLLLTVYSHGSLGLGWYLVLTGVVAEVPLVYVVPS